MVENWIIPFEGRNKSGTSQVNFLWRNGNIFLMDNHRAAMPSWLCSLDLTSQYQLLHIDAHYDAAGYGDKSHLDLLPEPATDKIGDYLCVDVPGTSYRLIRWDNYYQIVIDKYPSLISRIYMATHGEAGAKPKWSNDIFEEIRMSNLPQAVADFSSDDSRSRSWIINIDFDYFWCKGTGRYMRLFSDEYIRSVFASVKNLVCSGSAKMVTACFSPECCGGWKNAEETCAIFCAELGLEFNLDSGLK